MKNIVLFLRIFYYIMILPFLIHTKKIRELCKDFTPKRSRTNYQNNKIIRYTEFLVALRIPTFRNLCLKKSLILYKFLRENGVDVSINIGTRIDEKGKLRGHSWLTLDKKLFLSDKKIPEKFELLYTFPHIGQNNKYT